MLPRRLWLALVGAQAVAAATLLRSVAFDRWITVLASVLLLIGASAAHRGRAWGVALMLGSAVAFPVAWFIGIAPAWFCLVGLAGALPFALTSRAFARFDKGATVILALLAASLGTLGAVLWKEVAWSLFVSFPAIRPSIEPQHGAALTALVVMSAVVASRTRLRRAEEEVHVRIGEHEHEHERVRVVETRDVDLELAADLDETDARAGRRAQR